MTTQSLPMTTERDALEHAQLLAQAIAQALTQDEMPPDEIFKALVIAADRVVKECGYLLEPDPPVREHDCTDQSLCCIVCGELVQSV